VKSLIRILFRGVAVSAGILLVAVVVIVLGGAIARPGDRGVTPSEGVTVYLLSNGVHLDLLLPVEAAGIDWQRELLPAHLAVPRGDAPLIGFGWGDAGFYLSTPTWADLTLSTAVAALVGGGPTVMRVTRAWQGGGVAITLPEDRYRALAAAIAAGFERGPAGTVQPILGSGYGPVDVFYRGTGRYSAVLTCNEWIARALRQAGVRTPLWAPLPWPVLWQVQPGGF
jgi:uncharacterized protein (TIGR02117 family)